MKSGLLLFGHGARDPAWAQPFEAVAEAARRQAPGTSVQLAFLEFMAPDLAAAGAQMAMEGCERVHIVPLFLGAGGHVRKDLPRLVAELAAAHPQVDWQLAEAVGEHPGVIAALASAACEALGSRA